MPNQKRKTENNRVVAIVPAAGMGNRFGREKNKPLFSLLGKPLILWVLETLQGIDGIDEIIPVLKEGDLTACGGLVEQYGITRVRRIVQGGRERQDSVHNGIRALDDDVSVVIIHDGARPFAGRDIFARAIGELPGCDGVVAGVRVKDTIKEVGSRKSEARSQNPEESKKGIIVKRTLDRDVLWAVQTPQVFPYHTIKEAYRRADAEGFRATDDASLIERYGGTVKIIEGSYRNIKITTPEDIVVAEAILKGK